MAWLKFSRVISVLMVTAATSVAVAQAPAAPDQARMEQIVQTYVANGEFMGSVLVARGSEVLFSKSYGAANLEWNIPNAANTKFRIGSITKQFTAVSILLLEERGKLKVEDLVSKYLPDAPPAWQTMTIHHVLTHTAGLPNYTAQAAFAGEIGRHVLSPQQLVALFKDKPLEFAPGEKFNYSNSGYVLLGYLIEKITGQSYAQFLQENIFTPLAMKDSGYDSSITINPRHATGYTHQGGQFANATYVDMTTPFAAGALYSTTEDLLRWEQGLFGGKLLKAESLAKMLTPFKDTYAYGLFIANTGGTKVISHGGAINGFNTNMAYYPQTQMTVIALSNVQGGAPDAIVAQLGQVAGGKAVQLVSERRQITVPHATLARYVGTYEMAPGRNMSITLDGEQLLTQLSGQQKLQVFAESETLFFLKVVDAQLEFNVSAAGEVASVTLHQGGRDIPLRRISSTVTERKEVTLAADVLAAYPGTYAGQATFIITLENGHLMGQLVPQPKIELFAEAQDKFFLKVVDAQIEFVREAGKVRALILHQGPANMRAERQ